MFLGKLGAAVLGVSSLRPGVAHGRHRTSYVSCAADRQGRYLTVGLDEAGAVTFERPLPARGHGIAFHPRLPQCAVFARRPGTFVQVLDIETGAVVASIDAIPKRHFYGHGTYTRDGKLLLCSENDYPAGRGVVGLYDTSAGYKRIGEVPSHGVGPHDIRLLPGGKYCVVANGGILTHPETGRAKLNLSTMASNLAFLDSATGALVKRVGLPLQFQKLSMRHLDIDRNGRIAIAMQYEGDRRHHVPLMGLYEGGEAIQLLQLPENAARRMRHYTGDVTFDKSGTLLAASSPRGHRVTLWHGDSGRYLRQPHSADASGLTSTSRSSEILTTRGDGTIRRITANRGDDDANLSVTNWMRWDNHIAHRTTYSYPPHGQNNFDKPERSSRQA